MFLDTLRVLVTLPESSRQILPILAYGTISQDISLRREEGRILLFLSPWQIIARDEQKHLQTMGNSIAVTSGEYAYKGKKEQLKSCK